MFRHSGFSQYRNNVLVRSRFGISIGRYGLTSYISQNATLYELLLEAFKPMSANWKIHDWLVLAGSCPSVTGARAAKFIRQQPVKPTQ
ncbi:hypothetical protein [Collimonas silvisoli]|uniref:hypothetical protein n=1 Tax=Collimonas silvisoli TaxID=2825884 RepID=UPI001B8CB15D|nr:hypothetical protein [Collimonas silvisoli]